MNMNLEILTKDSREYFLPLIDLGAEILHQFGGLLEEISVILRFLQTKCFADREPTVVVFFELETE